MAALNGKVALVTGAGRGIGAAIARRLARDGARVVVNYSRSAGKAAAVIDAIRAAGGDGFAVQADVSNLDDIARMAKEVKERAGHLDILVNNAGHGTRADAGRLADMSVEDYDSTFALNTRGLFFTTQKLLPLIRNDGRIINFSSTATICRVPGLSAYAASKAAVEVFARIWAAELAERRITVNTVQPGMVNTDMITGGMGAEAMERAARHHPLKRIGEPEDLADIVAFLAAGDSRWVDGQMLTATGGG